jgi:hypothetical protein
MNKSATRNKMAPFVPIRPGSKHINPLSGFFLRGDEEYDVENEEKPHNSGNKK